MNSTKIKICGLFRLCDADSVNEAAPQYAGLVFYPHSHRFVSDEMAADLRVKLINSVETVGVFVNDAPAHIAELYRNGVISVIQLHGSETEEDIASFRKMLPGAEIWKAFKVRTAEDLYAAERSSADRILLDNGYGTGNPFNWSLADSFPRPFILAGGLTVLNIPGAIERFHPWALDISSGVESNGVKDKDKIKAAVAALKSYSAPDVRL